MLESSADALHVLSHDYTARYIAGVACEAALRTGRDERFLELFRRHESLLAAEDGGYWRPERHWPEPSALPLFAQLLDVEEPEEIHELTRELCRDAGPAMPRWIRAVWRSRTAAKLPLLGRLRVRVALWRAGRGRPPAG